MKAPLVFLGLLFLAGLAGCATAPVAPAQKGEGAAVSSAEEVQVGRGLSELIIKKKYPAFNDPAQQRYVNDVGRKIAMVSDRRDLVFHFTVLDSAEGHAFALPGGYIYFDKGLLERLDKSELAGLIAHEVGHVSARHPIQRLRAALGDDVLAGIAVAGLGKPDEAWVRAAFDLSPRVFDVLERGYDRKEELEADALGQAYLQRAGYDPAGLIKALEALSEGKGPRGRVFETSSDRRRMDERIKKLKEKIGQRPEAVV